jgi:hypothetical protein
MDAGKVLKKDQLKEELQKLKSGEVSHSQFFKEIIQILDGINATDEELKGVIPFLVSAMNTLIKNIEKGE